MIIDNNELTIKFEYRGLPKTTKQDKLNKETLEKIFDTLKNRISNDEYAQYFIELGKIEETLKNKKRTVLEKELTIYTSKNSFDYFIHKDLGGFLRRELDFYIKNEVLFIDDIGTENEKYLADYINQVKVIKSIAHKIIKFLEQIENFQKKLWLKKKFVVESNYCITLNRIPKKFYSEIAGNNEQIKEWVELFDIDSSNVDEDFLENNLYLLLDTKFFDEDFKEKIISKFDNLDEETNGLLIHSDNFQALNFIENKYNKGINGIYIDPPYNTDATEIIYKNGYKDSSWISLLADRLDIAKSLLQQDGILCATIDDYEVSNLYKLMEQKLYNYQIRPVVIEYNHRGRVKSNFAITHEFGLWAIPDGKDIITRKKDISEDIRRNLRRTGTDSTRESSPGLFYGIEVDKNTLEIIRTTEPLKIGEKIPSHKNSNTSMVWPIDDEGIERRWYYGRNRVEEESKQGSVWAKYIKGNVQVHYHQKGKPKLRKSVWVGSDLDASTYGSELLNSIFGMGNSKFSFPKSIFAVKESLECITYSTTSTFLDFFAGSGTTGHATIELNREDDGNRKYILVEMGEYFDIVTKPRIQKVIYSKEWKNGKPVDRDGVSHMFKYMVLEQYEDTLNNIKFDTNKEPQRLDERLQEEYILSYMLEMESKDSNALLNIDKLTNPFEYKLNIERNRETNYRNIDLVETFNYLLGVNVEQISSKEYYNYDGDDLDKYNGGKYIFKRVEGKLRDNKKVLIIWRNLTDDIKNDNDVLNKYFDKKHITLNEYDYVYINGDNTISINHYDNDKIKLIDEEFKNLMFDVENI